MFHFMDSVLIATRLYITRTLHFVRYLNLIFSKLVLTYAGYLSYIYSLIESLRLTQNLLPVSLMDALLYYPQLESENQTRKDDTN